MKKISAIILLLTLALSLFACGGEKQESSPAAGESSAAAGESSAAAGESSEEESSAAAGESSEEESSSAAEAHTHEFGEWKQTKEATYTEAGVETRECACGEKETRATEKKDPTELFKTYTGYACPLGLFDGVLTVEPSGNGFILVSNKKAA